jgi:hypothetical protein
VGVIAQGQNGAVGIQWIDNIENIGSTSTQTQVAGVVVNGPLGSTTGTVQIVTGFVSTASVAEHTWEFGTDGSIEFPDNTVQTTAYTGVNTTVAKDGPTLPTTTGVVDGLSHNSALTGLTDAQYGPFTLGTVTFSVAVSGGVINNFVSISGTATVNDVLGTIDSGDIGGGAGGGTTITITVDAVVQETPVAIDLTKTVNKLADGEYTLADGVEGQILYLVRQSGTISDSVFVDVENGDGDNPLRPFMTNGGFANVDNTGICTLIFTDGTWKQTGGLWD